MKYCMVVTLCMASLLSAVGCRADTPNIEKLKGYWVSDHHCEEPLSPFGEQKYTSNIIGFDDSSFYIGRSVGVKYICKSSCKKGITIVRKVDDEEFGSFIILKPDKIQFISKDNGFTYKDTYTRRAGLDVKSNDSSILQYVTEGPDDNRPK